jgi:tetratricopeptide (TPR) repeat protein
LVQEGQAARDQGRFDDALALFRQAQAVDPYDPAPCTNQAFLFAYAERYGEAIECFERVERLAPGWPSSRTGLWLVQRLLVGEYPYELLPLAMGLGNSKPDDPAALESVRQARRRFPGLAMFYLEGARYLRATGEIAKMEAALRQGLLCDGDMDVRTRLLLELGQISSGEERESLLQQAVELNGSLRAAAVAKLMLREPKQSR